MVHDALAMVSGIGFYAFLAVVAIVLMEGMRSALRSIRAFVLGLEAEEGAVCQQDDEERNLSDTVGAGNAIVLMPRSVLVHTRESAHRENRPSALVPADVEVRLSATRFVRRPR